MKYYEIIETLIKVDEQSIISAVNKNGVNVNNEYYNTFISHNLITSEIINYLSGEYYLENIFSNNKKNNIVKFIEKHYKDSEKLYSAFKSNLIFGKELIQNYINHKVDSKRINKIIKLSIIGQLEILSTLNPYYISVDNYSFLTDKINFVVKNYVINIILATTNDNMISYFRDNFDESDYFLRTLLGNAYKILSFRKENNYIYNYMFKFIEKSDYKDIKFLFLSDDNFFINICKCAFDYYRLPVDLIEKTNLIILKDNKLKEKLKELNSLIEIEMMSDFYWVEKQKRK